MQLISILLIFFLMYNENYMNFIKKILKRPKIYNIKHNTLPQ